MERMIQVEKENVEQSVFVEREPMTLNIGGTTDYNGLSNKPSINGTTLSGDKSLSDLGINIPDVSDFITKDVNDLTYYTLATNTGSTIELTINNSTYVMTLNLKNASGTTISTQSIDLPLETMVVNGSYDSTNKKVILTLQNGNTVDFSVADLVSGLQSEITSSNKLSSDLVDDTNHTNKFVTSAEKEKINIITSNGTGNNYLANDGTYKEIDLSSYAPKTMIGDLENLDTTDKSNLVSAINEVAGKGGVDDTYIPIYAFDISENVSGYNYYDFSNADLVKMTNIVNDAYQKGHHFFGIGITKSKAYSGSGPYVIFTNTTYDTNRSDIQKKVTQYMLFATAITDGFDSTTMKYIYGYKLLLYISWNNNIATVTSGRIRGGSNSYLSTLNSSSYTPTGDYNPATKKYVDDSISSAVGDIETILTTLTTGNGV